MKDFGAHSKRSVQGSVTIVVTISLTTMLGLLGLVFDIGYGYYLQQVAQGAADAAALAAVSAAKPTGISALGCGTAVLCQTSYTCPASPTNATNFGVGCMYAKQNGFKSSGSQTVTISGGTGNPPSVSGLTTGTYWAQVEAKQSTGVGFLRVLDAMGMDIVARATAVLTGNGDQFCIYVMDPAASGAASLSGNGAIGTTCGMYVNSTSSTALQAVGNASVSTTQTDIVGSYSGGNNTHFTPTPSTGSSTIQDPLASLPAPVYSGCDHTNFSTAGTATLNPGVYCNGISISGSGTVTFTSGVYILNGGGLNISSSGFVYGSGVMFYNAQSSSYAFQPINISGTTNVSLSAPTSGTYQGILFFEDRSVTSTVQNIIAGGANLAISGTIYMPTGSLQFTGGSSTSPLVVAIVCRRLTITGGAYMQYDPTGAQTGIGKMSVALVQ